VARGLYVNPRAHSLLSDVLSALVGWLRPWDFNYLSLECVLAEAGWVSQIPFRLTVMTTGRSQTFHTPYGTIEFTHTARDPRQLRTDVAWDARRALWVATPALALAHKDLAATRRNLGLVEPMRPVIPGRQNRLAGGLVQARHPAR